MVSSHLISILLSVGLLGFQANARPSVDLDAIAPAVPIRIEDLQGGIAKRAQIPSRKRFLGDDENRKVLDAQQKRSVESAMNNAIEMRPIREDDLIPTHLMKREDPLSRLDLRKDITMIYGGAAMQQQMYLANMTLHAPDPEHPLILMEKFDGLTTSLQCSSRTKMNIVFKSKKAMDYAVAAWKWVNSAEPDYFWLIANHPTCCPSSQRAPYKVTGVEIDDKALTAHLTVEKTVWKTVAGNFDLSLGRYNLPKNAKRHFEPAALTKRFFGLDSLAIKLINFLGIAPDIKSMDSIFIDLSLGKKVVELFRDPFHEDPYLKVNCLGCGTHGGVELGVRVKAEGGEVKNLGIFVQPKGLSAKMEVQFRTLANLARPVALTVPIVPDLAIPGFSIPFLFTFGPSIQFNAGFEVDLDGIGNVTTGVEVKMPDSAMIAIDMVADKSGVTGLSNVTIDPFFRVNEVFNKFEAGAYIGPSIAFGAKVLDVFTYEGALEIKMPYIAAQAHAGYKKDGYCPKAAVPAKRKVTTGLDGGLTANFELWFKLGGRHDVLIPIPDWVPDVERKIWSLEHPFLRFCLPIELPGYKSGGKPAPPSKTLSLTGSITNYKTRTFSAQYTAAPLPITRIEVAGFGGASNSSGIETFESFQPNSNMTNIEMPEPTQPPEIEI